MLKNQMEKNLEAELKAEVILGDLNQANTIRSPCRLVCSQEQIPAYGPSV